MTKIPDLHNGEWRRWNGTPVYQDFALYHIAWKHNVFEQRQLPFYPFFWRDPQGYIYFPSFGENWIWGCELNAAIESGIPLDITVYEGWEFVPYSDDKPFAFLVHDTHLFNFTITQPYQQHREGESQENAVGSSTHVERTAVVG
jgi:hypothetical protein